MIGNEIESMKNVTLAEVLDILEARKKISPLSYEQETSYDYCSKFSKLSIDQALELKEKLMKNDKIKESLACKLVDVLPTIPPLVKVFLVKDRVDLSESEINEILTLILDYVKANKSTKTKETKETKETKTKETKETKPKKTKK